MPSLNSFASTTQAIRVWNMRLFTLTVIATLFAWIIFDKNPSDAAFLLGTLAATTGIGEASAVGKRATFKKEAVHTEA